MVERTKCPGCGIEHLPNENWLHMECVTNLPVLEQSAPTVSLASVINTLPATNIKPEKTKSGRDREKYNAYMRDYMKRRRGK